MEIDVLEAAQILESSDLQALVWRFEKCPLKELRTYVPNGFEELVVFCYEGDDYLSFRLTWIGDPLPEAEESAKSRITFAYLDGYRVHILLSYKEREKGDTTKFDDDDKPFL